MSKYLVKVSYTPDGVKGLLKEGATSRKKTVEELVTSMGGKTEAFYYAFGDYDVYCIFDIPDAVTAAALALALNSSGLVSCSTTVLMSPEDVDKAKNKVVHYRGPGQ
jgi:uncharacterized protein with GYD domain